MKNQEDSLCEMKYSSQSSCHAFVIRRQISSSVHSSFLNLSSSVHQFISKFIGVHSSFLSSVEFISSSVHQFSSSVHFYVQWSSQFISKFTRVHSSFLSSLQFTVHLSVQWSSQVSSDSLLSKEQ